MNFNDTERTDLKSTHRSIRRLANRLLVTAGALAVAAPAVAEIVNIEWDGQGAFDKTVQIAPGKFVEACGKLKKGQTVAWSFKSEAFLNFNVHYHEGKKVVFPEKRDEVAQLAGELKVPLDQDYCWMWTNKGGTATPLSVQLHIRS